MKKHAAIKLPLYLLSRTMIMMVMIVVMDVEDKDGNEERCSSNKAPPVSLLTLTVGEDLANLLPPSQQNNNLADGNLTEISQNSYRNLTQMSQEFT